ncbi:MAG: glycosyltransferase, partial [Geminicoccaceae bacterium]|nr:glycosyltransferase [Geminicoccaceae bacterium]
MSPLIVLAAGGTGGHMFPAMAVAAELRDRGFEALIVCDARGGRFVENRMPHRIIAAA